MNNKQRAWLLVGLVALICGGAVWSVALFRSRTITPAALLKRIPATNAVVVYLDFTALRRSGILDLLDSPKVAQEPEYQDFVRKTDFDYKQDLDTALVAFAPAGKYMLLRGRFDWKSLRSYVEGQSGRCYNSLCRLQGSTPDRRISFFPVQSNLMALAVSEDDSAALRMQESGGGPAQEIPSAPVWMSIPKSILQSGDSLPAGTRAFARSMERAESVVISLVPQADRLSANLDVRCHDNQEAAGLAAELSHTTALLRQMIERERQTPNPADFSGVLSSGSFHNEGTRVLGSWRIERAFVENMLAGGQS